MGEVITFGAARVHGDPGDRGARLILRHPHVAHEPLLVEREDELHFTVGVHLVDQGGQQALQHVAIAQPTSVGPVFERLGRGQTVFFEQPLVITT